MVAPADRAHLPLLNDWQQRFPLVREPFAAIARDAGLALPEVLRAYRERLGDGTISRIGGVFAAGAGGAGLLAAMAVPQQRLHEVAARVSAHPGVNHNYEREGLYNLWFVMTGAEPRSVDAAIDALEQATGLPALRLRMQRAYRIDLGFDLRGSVAPPPAAAPVAGSAAAAVAAADRPLAALAEAGLPVIERPYDAWAQALGRSSDAVLQRLAEWLQAGTLKRFGVVVRHHELGFAANAMTVFDVPDAEVDRCGQALARARGVTLCYRRTRAPQWRYNLYCMVHGRDRASVLAALDEARAGCALGDYPSAVLFSRQRFKQVGARRFRDALATEGCDAAA